MKGISWHLLRRQRGSSSPRGVGSSRFLMAMKRIRSFLSLSISRILQYLLLDGSATRSLIAFHCQNSTLSLLTLQMNEFWCIFSLNSWLFIAIFISQSCFSEFLVTDSPRPFSCLRSLTWCRQDQGEVDFLQISWVNKYHT